MNAEEFKAIYMGNFELEPNERILWEIAKRYHETCEAYDRTVCSGALRYNSLMPSTGEEMRLINKHARKVFCDLFEGATFFGITYDEMHKAVREYRD